MINKNENKLENRVYDFFQFINACNGNGEISWAMKVNIQKFAY